MLQSDLISIDQRTVSKTFNDKLNEKKKNFFYFSIKSGIKCIDNHLNTHVFDWLSDSIRFLHISNGMRPAKLPLEKIWFD